MGCEGGSIPKRSEMVKTKREVKDSESKSSAYIELWTRCQLSKMPLQQPIVADYTGRMYNKEAIIEYLLSPTGELPHVKRMKDVVTLNLTDNPADQQDQTSKFICPVTMKEMNGSIHFVFIAACGCVMSEQALREVKTATCLKCGGEFKQEDVIPLNAVEEEYETLRRNHEGKRGEKHKAKKRKTQDEEKPQKVTKTSDPLKEHAYELPKSLAARETSKAIQSMYSTAPKQRPFTSTIKRKLPRYVLILAVLGSYYYLFVKLHSVPKTIEEAVGYHYQQQQYDSEEDFEAPREDMKGESISWSDDIKPCLRDYIDSRSYQDLVKCVKTFNKESPVLNQDLFPLPADMSNTIVVALIVHKRDMYLERVLEYLREVRGISEVTLVISHDGYFPAMVDLVKSIDFCRVKQVFHPYANGLVEAALKTINSDQKTLPTIHMSVNGKTLVNYDYKTAPDSFLADPRLVQASPKHHYWWLWNYIFRKHAHIPSSLLPYSQEIQTLFLEEDHIVTRDIIDHLISLLELKRKHCPECTGINLGFHGPKLQEIDVKQTWNQVALDNFWNIGMSFNKTAFLHYFIPARSLFCGFNDYNWDLTMAFLEHEKVVPEAALTSTLSRVYHIGTCGMHTHGSKCSPDDYLTELDEKVILPLEQLYDELSPSEDKRYIVQKAKLKFKKVFRTDPFSKRPTSDGVEGWLDGNLWDPEAPGRVLDRWESNVNKVHCMNIAESEFGWLE